IELRRSQSFSLDTSRQGELAGHSDGIMDHGNDLGRRQNVCGLFYLSGFILGMHGKKPCKPCTSGKLARFTRFIGMQSTFKKAQIGRSVISRHEFSNDIPR
ncbi:MAG: hypothetical protein ACK5CQ_10165, partial [Cyanobacteriota bacterium]